MILKLSWPAAAADVFPASVPIRLGELPLRELGAASSYEAMRLRSGIWGITGS